ncbi:MAG: hypothetical protein HYV27_18565 [Candidatus Hydrogenedentes bacterium]|nr:hypothetical protein [Candidatus Hydrogenedentota bacterium]
MRRQLLLRLYENYMRNPMELLTPGDLYAVGFSREDLLLNMHYLGDRRLVELMHGPISPFFTSARITADGIDLVERPFEFGLRFPPDPDLAHPGVAELPRLLERLVDEVEFCPLNGERRRALQRDVNYVRDEIARPMAAWRRPVILAVLGWMEEAVQGVEEGLPSLERIRAILAAPGDLNR